MKIWIKNKKLLTSLYTKPLNLHLFIPPHSCHPPGVFKGLIFGHIQRIFILCSRNFDILKELDLFFERLLDRGFNPIFLESLFSKAISNATRFHERFFKSSKLSQNLKKQQNTTNNNIFFHIPFHPSHPNSKIKQAWKNIVHSPAGKHQINQLTTDTGQPLPVGILIMCFHKAPNLGNLLSYRDLSKRMGPKVSAYLA